MFEFNKCSIAFMLAYADERFECVWPFCGVGSFKRVCLFVELCPVYNGFKSKDAVKFLRIYSKLYLKLLFMDLR